MKQRISKKLEDNVREVKGNITDNELVCNNCGSFDRSYSVCLKLHKSVHYFQHCIA